MSQRRCRHCRCRLSPSRNRNQKYCSQAACQRARKTKTERHKRKTDPDYRENQRLAQKRWRDAHPNYSRQYRESHPDYVGSNREAQRQRNCLRRGRNHPPLPQWRLEAGEAGLIAKMDTLTSENDYISLSYKPNPGQEPVIAKMDAKSLQPIDLDTNIGKAVLIAKRGLDRHSDGGLLGSCHDANRPHLP